MSEYIYFNPSLRQELQKYYEGRRHFLFNKKTLPPLNIFDDPPRHGAMNSLEEHNPCLASLVETDRERVINGKPPLFTPYQQQLHLPQTLATAATSRESEK